MSYPTARVLAVLELLQTHGRMRGEEIAARLEVDVRTIRRYILILRDRGMPIEMERGRYGGYRLPAGFKMPLALTEQEALAVTYGLLSMRQQRLVIDASDSEQALTKIMRVLPARTRALVQDLDHAVTFAFPTLTGGASFAVAHLEVVVRAIRTHHRLSLDYSAWSGDMTTRAVDPYQVVFRGGRWYLVGYCHLRVGQRVFRIDHIRRATELPATFDPPTIDALAAVEQAIAQVPWSWEFAVQLELPLAEAWRRIPATVATLTAQADGVMMRGFADDLAWLAYLLAGLGCQIVIHQPPELRAHLLALAAHIQSLGTEGDGHSRKD